MKRISIVMLTGFLYIHQAWSGESQATPASSTEGTAPLSTQQWLELQRFGKAASSQAQPLSGEAMNKVHSRYLKSFEKPIPEFFEHDTRVAH